MSGPVGVHQSNQEPPDSTRRALFDFAAIASGHDPAHPAGPLLRRWLEAARGRRIVLADGPDARALQAAETLAGLGIRTALLGRLDDVEAVRRTAGLHLSDDIEIVDPASAPDRATLAWELQQRQAARGLTDDDALALIWDPLYFGGMLVRTGQADGCVGGATRTTGDVLRAAVRAIGLADGVSLVSSLFIIVLPDGRILGYGDCGIVLYPTADQLATIAVSCARTYGQLVGAPPVVAMLSYSTKGSAGGESVEKVARAMEGAREMAPDLEIDGELQFDAAWVEEIGRRKAPASTVPGRANVFIFPNLDAGNIAYKITERLAGGVAFGPILQGLARPMNDLSRGCRWEDIVAVAAICAVQARGAHGSAAGP